MAWLRQRGSIEHHHADSIDQGDKVVQFPDTTGRSAEARGQEALELVYRAAEAIRGMEDRARGIAEDAVEKLQVANARIQALEGERRASEVRIQEAEDALKRAASRIAAAEDRLAQAERAARAAELRASEGEKALIRIEDAVRTRLLGQRRPTGNRVATA